MAMRRAALSSFFSSTTVRAKLKSPCVRAEHEIFDGFEGKVHGQAHSDDEERDPRCAPDHRNTTLKVHVGPVSGHVANWGAVEETLRGTRYEHFLSE